MRQRSMSVFVPKEGHRLSKKFEGVVSDNEEHSDAASDADDDSTEEGSPSKRMVANDDVGNDWVKADYELLLEKLKSAIAPKDKRKHKLTLRAIDWKALEIRHHPPEEVEKVTESLVAKCRLYRTLGEILEDFPAVFNKILIAEKPKPPLSAYNLYFKENYARLKEENKEATSGEIFKLASKSFQTLSEKKKRKYETAAARCKEIYQENLAEFYKTHPDLVPQKKERKTSTRSSKTAKEQKKTPFHLFYLSRKEASVNISQQQARTEWEDLPLKKKLVFIKESFVNESDGKLLNKKEQEMLDRHHGKPDFIGRNAYEYFRKRNTGKDKDTLTAEYRALNERQLLDLKIEYMNAREEYVSQYQNYIKNLPAEKRQVEIDYLTSMMEKNKKDKTAKSITPQTPRRDELYPGSAEEDPPVAESTTIKKMNGKSRKRDAVEVNQPSPSTPKKRSPPLQGISTIAEEPVPVKKNKKPKAEPGSPAKKTDTSIVKTEPKTRLPGECFPQPKDAEKPKKGDKASKQSSKSKAALVPPERPPNVAKEFYRMHIYKGKVGKHLESYANLSSSKKREIRDQMKAAQKQYLVDFENFLKSMPPDKMRDYIQTANISKRAQPEDESELEDTSGSSSADDDSDDDDSEADEY